MTLSNVKTAIIAAILIVFVQVMIGFVVSYTLPTWAERGQFGDLFGAANSLFSGLAFAGLIYAILLQREDLELQRKELQLTRLELKRAAKAQEQSEIALRSQAEAALQSAKISATSLLLEHYRNRLAQMKNQPFTSNDPRLKDLREMQRREAILFSVLNDVYLGVTKNDDDIENW